MTNNDHTAPVEREDMRAQDISQARDPILRGSLAAMKRAAMLARKTAIQTDTGIVVVRDGKIVHVSAQELRRTMAAEMPHD